MYLGSPELPSVSRNSTVANPAGSMTPKKPCDVPMRLLPPKSITVAPSSTMLIRAPGVLLTSQPPTAYRVSPACANQPSPTPLPKSPWGSS
jgi:hypothetical protein